MALVAQRTGMKLQHVPFNGSGGMNTVMSGETPVMTTVPGGITELLRTGRLKGLAVTGETRLAELPEVPTFKELGLDISIPGWYSIVVRQGTPRP
jgi:tripartite-type tricarboxylate transporter receptor subunit TctC